MCESHLSAFLCFTDGKTRTKDKYRVVYTDHQRLELEKEFHYSKYITIRRKSELATALSLSERQVTGSRRTVCSPFPRQHVWLSHPFQAKAAFFFLTSRWRSGSRIVGPKSVKSTRRSSSSPPLPRPRPRRPPAPAEAAASTETAGAASPWWRAAAAAATGWCRLPPFLWTSKRSTEETSEGTDWKLSPKNWKLFFFSRCVVADDLRWLLTSRRPIQLLDASLLSSVGLRLRRRGLVSTRWKDVARTGVYSCQNGKCFLL